jgi:hypothetical protein
MYSDVHERQARRPYAASAQYRGLSETAGSQFVERFAGFTLKQVRAVLAHAA